MNGCWILPEPMGKLFWASWRLKSSVVSDRDKERAGLKLLREIYMIMVG